MRATLYFKSEVTRWTEVAQRAGISAQEFRQRRCRRSPPCRPRKTQP